MTEAIAFPVPIHGRLDLDGRLIEADPPLAALHERAGGRPAGVIAIPQIAAIARLVRRLGIVVSRGIVAADGARDLNLWIRARPVDGVIAIAITDWTERAAAPPYPATRTEREEDFRRAAADWHWDTDADLRLTGLSAGLASAAGGIVPTLLGSPLTRLFTLVEDGEGALPLLAAAAGRRGFDDQHVRLRGGGEPLLRLAAVPLVDGGGRFLGFRGIAVPIGEKEAAAAREAATPPVDAAAFGERLGQALRVPLDRIIADAEAIRTQSDGPINRDYASYATDIASAGRHLLGLVDDLVDLQAIERADFAPAAESIDLADVGRHAAGLLGVRAVASDVRIDRPEQGLSVIARGDFRRALQVLVNLVGNAVRHSPAGGTVWIRCERDGDLATVIVADQGRGVAADDHERIFEKFARIAPYAPGGTGLGLYIARRLARAMGGDIAIDSEPGQGARFIFTLPAA